MSSVPLLTVATLSYNTGNYVVEALDCVKRQGYPNIQHIIIDDCSQDDSVEVIDEWIRANNYSCTFIKREVNRGVQSGVKEIFYLARGKYIVFISDDLWLENVIVNLVAKFEKLNDSYAMIYGDTQMIDKNGEILKPSMFEFYRGENFVPPTGDIFREVVKDFYFFIQSSIISLSHFRQLDNVFNSEIISEDWDWQLGLSRDFNILGVKDVYGQYRYHDNSITRTTWTDGKIAKVWKSHAKMLLNYYNHPKNTKYDKELIFQKVWKYYRLLSKRSDFSTQEKKNFLRTMFRVTHRIELKILILNPVFSTVFHKFWMLFRSK